MQQKEKETRNCTVVSGKTLHPTETELQFMKKRNLLKKCGKKPKVKAMIKVLKLISKHI